MQNNEQAIKTEDGKTYIIINQQQQQQITKSRGPSWLACIVCTILFFPVGVCMIVYKLLR